MGRKTGLVVAGFLIGSIVALTVPAVAHHSPAVQRVQRRLTALTNRVASVESGQSSLNSRVNSHQTSINALNNETQLLDPDGFYFGPILKDQVFSGVCAHGDDALWQQHPDVPSLRFLSCTTGPYRVNESRAAFQRLK